MKNPPPSKAQKAVKAMKNLKSLSGAKHPLEKMGKKTTQGNGLRSKPKRGQKRYRGQGK